ncbi:MAG: YhgE/Pip domain-containing protein [Alcaligenaceae bacterium]|nr:YhgE/Pip domain-containing protein [Alcaligenaceae bacterium]
MKKSTIKKTIVVTAILLLPFLYSLFFLKAFWDPYANMHDLPVGIVNLDEGTHAQDIVKNLEEANVMKVKMVATDELAIEGLEKQKYYATITFPKDFSSRLENIANVNRDKNVIIFRNNKKYNFITSQIYERVVSEVQKQLERKISEQVVGGLSQKIHQGLDGLKTLNEGLEKLSHGGDSINGGMATLNEGYQKFDQGVDALERNVDSLSKGVKKINQGVKKYTKNVDIAVDALEQISQGVITLSDKLPILKASDEFMKLHDGAQKVLDKKVRDRLHTASVQLAMGAQELSEKVGNVTRYDVKHPKTLNQGVHMLRSSSLKIKDGIVKIYDGSNQLSDGLDMAHASVSDKLEISLKESVNLTGLATYMESPTEIEEENINDVANYGTAFAPYFLSLSLWVGSLILVIGLYYDPMGRFGRFDHNYNHKRFQLFNYLGLVLLGGLAFAFLNRVVFNFGLKHLVLYVLSIELIFVAFFLIVYGLILWFKDPGKFAAILLLILQLSASGGTFPIETTPPFYQSLYALMPMRYSIALLKEALITVEKDFLTANLAVMSGIAGVFFVLVFLTAWFMDYKTNKSMLAAQAQEVGEW